MHPVSAPLPCLQSAGKYIPDPLSDPGSSVLNQYVTTVKPMHEQFVEPSKKYADIIIPRGGENKIGIHILQEHLKLMLD